MVPPPMTAHQRFAHELLVALLPLTNRLGLEILYEVGMFRATDDYRQPDLVVARPEHFTDRGLEGPAELVVEVLSPNDESRAKLAFYAAMATAEVLLVDPETRAFELLRLTGSSYERVQPATSSLGFTLAVARWSTTHDHHRHRLLRHLESTARAPGRR
jgi:Uma2 family endonuclease